MPSRRRLSDPIPERYHDSGRLALSRYHVALMQGLLDRPGGAALGVRDFILAAWPYGQRICPPGQALFTTLRVFIPALPTSWVSRRKVGRHTRYELQPRGRAVLAGEVEANLTRWKRYVPGEWRTR